MLADFYQLSRDPVERILPVIAGRILSDGGRLLVVSQSAEQRGIISDALWSHAPESFLAHGDADGDRPQVQPILLSAIAQAENGARNIALADGIWRQEAGAFDRAFLFFDQAGIGGARDCWRLLGGQEGVERRFWRQEGRKWVQGP